MDVLTFWGIFAIGFVFGYLLYYAIRHTNNFNLDLLSSAVGAVGGAGVIGWLGKTEGWVGPYGLGIAAGFLFYLLLVLLLIFAGNFSKVGDNKVLLVGKTLAGIDGGPGPRRSD
jgi:hypothetical protein